MQGNVNTPIGQKGWTIPLCLYPVTPMTEPKMHFDGNLRLASTHSDGYPADPEASCELVLEEISEQAVNPYGAIQIFFNLPPDASEGSAPDSWPCQVGSAITGLGRASSAVFIEDYRGLHALSLTHMASIKTLANTYQRLRDHAQAMGFRIRPYWRIALKRSRLADGNILPACEVSVFLDR